MFFYSKCLCLILLIVLPSLVGLLLECQGNNVTNISNNKFYYNYKNGSYNPIIKLIERHYASISLLKFLFRRNSCKSSKSSKSRHKGRIDCIDLYDSKRNCKRRKDCKAFKLSLGDYIVRWYRLRLRLLSQSQFRF